MQSFVMANARAREIYVYLKKIFNMPIYLFLEAYTYYVSCDEWEACPSSSISRPSPAHNT